MPELTYELNVGITGRTRLTLSPNTLETKRIKMLERYKDIFLNS